MTISPALLRAVQRVRRSYRGWTLPLPVAVSIARSELAHPEGEYAFLDGLEAGDTVSGSVEGFDIKVSVVYDEESRLGEDDVTGWFTDTYTDGCIPNRGGSRNGYKWYHPSNATLAYTYDELRKAGMSKAVARDTYREIVEQEMEDDRERYWLGVVVTVSLAGEELAGDSLWGIDMIPRINATPYLIETATDCISQAIGSARESLPKAVERTEERLQILRQAAAEGTDRFPQENR